MIHIDTNLLIASIDPTHEHANLWPLLITAGDSFAVSAVAWTEFRSYPISDQQLRVLDRLLGGGVLAYERVHAELAGELFSRTNSKRKNRLDTMIAATAILADAELATANQADFKAFVSLGLKLYRF
jgi:predicted nucleic acid-binding protein